MMQMAMAHRTLVRLLPLFLSVRMAAAAAPAVENPRELARSILEELIGIDTTDSVGDNTAAAEAMARRLRAAGFPEEQVVVVVPASKKGNLVARFPGTGHGKPVLIIAHLDVVEARRSDWTMDPFHLSEKDGYFYGRGTQDMKGDAALLVANFIRLKREGFRPDRDLIKGSHSPLVTEAQAQRALRVRQQYVQSEAPRMAATEGCPAPNLSPRRYCALRVYAEALR